MDKEATCSKSNGTVEGNYYEILGCDQKASFFELKRNYQQLIKKYHPDKHEGSSSTSEKFIAIDKAYKTLMDENSRKDYDTSLLKRDFDEHFLIHVELSQSELDFSEDDTALYLCRCGENFVIHKKDLNEGGYVMECFQCSNSILIK
ncbi:dnaJ homolog subfamily C member 24-like [Anoplophora glabripennis]|uniref:dnaJ homolog subfamily C member 24-like n=1 Tax=Anoplophora glabripennis TaxID=217634 RepID=UPI0008751274|nr:dnaJ homolog subfamily C member 24-like [Anoplophora glabripennis]